MRTARRQANKVASARALAQLESSALRDDARANLAVELRRVKHIDPVLGVIAAYVYDPLSDIASIRRIACGYVQHQQPIPLDVALLG